MIRFQCPGCGHSYNVSEADAGKRAKCKSCQKTIAVPDTPTLEPSDGQRVKPQSAFAKLPLALKAVLGLCLIILASYAIYQSMPDNRELTKARAERDRLNQKLNEQRTHRFANDVADVDQMGKKDKQAAVNKMATKPEFAPGESVVLQSTGRFVYVYPTLLDWDQAAKHWSSNDEDGLVLMARQDRLLQAEPGTPARYLDSRTDVCEVRIKGGELNGKSGWVLKENVKKADATAPAQPTQAEIAGEPATPKTSDAAFKRDTPGMVGLYLEQEGLKTRDYVSAFGDQDYAATSDYKEIGGGTPPCNLAYFVEGSKSSIRRVHLTLNVNNQGGSKQGQLELAATSERLTKKATGQSLRKDVREAIEAAKAGDWESDGVTFKVIKNDFKGTPEGYSLSFQIE